MAMVGSTSRMDRAWTEKAMSAVRSDILLEKCDFGRFRKIAEKAKKSPKNGWKFRGGDMCSPLVGPILAAIFVSLDEPR